MSDSGDVPREYDKSFTKPESGPVQIRIGLSTERGEVRRFLVQLEYHLHGEWLPVVRYDHDDKTESEQAHDVREEGLHMDVFRADGEADPEDVSGPMPPDDALEVAEAHLSENLERFIERFEEWHGINNQ